MGALTYGAIQAGAVGFAAPQVLAAFAVAVVSLAGFVAVEARAAHPMVPLGLVRSRNVSVPVAVGAGGIERDVSFEHADAIEPTRIDDAYRAKYGPSPYVDAMLSAGAASTTLRLIPSEPAS